MTTDVDYEEHERQWALPWRKDSNPPGAALIALVLLAFALIGLQDGKRPLRHHRSNHPAPNVAVR